MPDVIMAARQSWRRTRPVSREVAPLVRQVKDKVATGGTKACRNGRRIRTWVSSWRFSWAFRGGKLGRLSTEFTRARWKRIERRSSLAAAYTRTSPRSAATNTSTAAQHVEQVTAWIRQRSPGVIRSSTCSASALWHGATSRTQSLSAVSGRGDLDPSRPLLRVVRKWTSL